MSYLKETAESGYNQDSIGSFYKTMVPWLMQALGIGMEILIVDVGAARVTLQSR